jgi:hypothetical protein
MLYAYIIYYIIYIYIRTYTHLGGGRMALEILILWDHTIFFKDLSDSGLPDMSEMVYFQNLDLPKYPAGWSPPLLL